MNLIKKTAVTKMVEFIFKTGNRFDINVKCV